MLKDNPDEIPISGIKKTFEELLEEKLREEGKPTLLKRDITPKEFLKKTSKQMMLDNKQNAKPYQSKLIEDKSLPNPITKTKKINREASLEKELDINDQQLKCTTAKPFLKRGEGKMCLTDKSKTNKKTKSITKIEEQQSAVIKQPQKVNIAKISQEEKVDARLNENVRLKSQTKINADANNKQNTEETIYYDISALKYDQNETIPEEKKEKSPQENILEVYNEKIIVIDEQINRFREEASQRKKENKLLKSNLMSLENDMTKFSENRNYIIQELKDFRESELKRIKKERINLEKNSKIQQPTKNEEIEELRLNLFKIQEEVSIKDFKDKENLDALSKELSSLNNEINEIETQVKIREQLLIKEQFKKPTSKQTNEKVLKNGTKIRNFPDGRSVIYFQNGDIKESHPDGKIIYQYHEAQITQTTFPDGIEISEFSNGQIEKLFPNGRKEITYEDGSTQTIYPESLSRKK